MKATKIKWQINQPEDMLRLPGETNLPAEIFFKTVDPDAAIWKLADAGTVYSATKSFLESKFRFPVASFEIEEGEVLNDLNLLNRILEEKRGNYGQYTTVLELLDMGVKPCDLITRYHFDESPVKDAVEAETASYPEELE